MIDVLARGDNKATDTQMMNLWENRHLRKSYPDS